jgi:Fe-S cluster assembly protein SufD
VAHTGGRLVRSDVRAWLGGENGNAVLDGLHLLHGRRHIDTNMWVDHAAPHCESHELYKSVLDDQSTSAFRGRIHVHRDAQKTDGYQSNQNLLLSRESTAWADPQLEIYADDVKCSHGATVGQLDDRALFYLRSRGVPKDAARALLVLAFAGEVLDAIQIEAVRERIRALVERRLPRTAPLA